MSVLQEKTVPLYEEIVNEYNQRAVTAAAGGESSDLRRSRQSAFEKFRLLGFPTIKNEDWKYTNITRFLRDEFALDGLVAGAGAVSVPAAPEAVVSKATI